MSQSTRKEHVTLHDLIERAKMPDFPTAQWVRDTHFLPLLDGVEIFCEIQKLNLSPERLSRLTLLITDVDKK